MDETVLPHYFSGATNVLTTTPLWVANTRLKLQGIKWRFKDAENGGCVYNGIIGETGDC